jgi:hypothetical protein
MACGPNARAMTLLQSILKFVEEQKADSGYKVASIFASEKVLVLESSASPTQAKVRGDKLAKAIRDCYPGCTAEQAPPDLDGCTIGISY